MRKRLITATQPHTTPPQHDWLDLEHLAEVEISSEDAAHPIESALLPDRGPGWRAAAPGEQTVRILFDRPQPLRHIRLEFRETERSRTQEYVLRWSPDRGQPLREIVRQQWNFSAGEATDETEDHRVDLPAVSVLELRVVPDVSGGSAVASLARMRLA